jgi:hypothetical protein
MEGADKISISINEFYEQYYIPSLNLDREIIDLLYTLNLQAHTNGDDYIVLERWLCDLITENKRKNEQLSSSDGNPIEREDPSQQADTKKTDGGCFSSIILLLAVVLVIAGIIGFAKGCS